MAYSCSFTNAIAVGIRVGIRVKVKVKVKVRVETSFLIMAKCRGDGREPSQRMQCAVVAVLWC